VRGNAGRDEQHARDRVTERIASSPKVHARSVEALEAVIDEIIPFAMTITSIIQSSPVAPRLPPLPSPAR
jgi:Lrp/AsnC family leucine-responsive transcriptional regulator